MKNFLLGAVAALVIVAAIAAGIYFIPPLLRPAPPPPPSPAEVARSIRPGFIGRQRIGEWILACHRVRQIPHRASIPGVTYGTHIIGGRPGEAGGSAAPAVRVPNRPCRVFVNLRDPHDPDDVINPMFVLLGPGKGVLNLVVRLPPEFVPNPPRPRQMTGVIPGRVPSSPPPTPGIPPQPILGDSLEVQLSGSNIKVPVRVCAGEFCLAILSIPPGGEPKILSTKKFVLVLPPQKGKRIALKISADGLAPAIATMRRMADALAKS